MCQIHQEAHMGFTEETFPVGTHMCLIYSDEAERRSTISKFLDAGLMADEKVAYFADMMSPDDVLDWLTDAGVKVAGNGKADQFSVSVAEETYCPNGKFVPNEMLDTRRVYHTRLHDEGYCGGRVSGEMSWATKGIPGSDRLMEYEALVNKVLKTHPITAVCQYDANRFSGATIVDVLKVHPMMIVRGQIVRNPYYMKPEDFLKDFRERE
jgi:hypothetical protein